jgi:replication factor C subunit 2/4
MTTPWVEKYRPKTVEDVCHQEEAIATLKNALETGNLPHLLFYGPPGTGKTSAVSAMVRQMFGPVVKDRVLELNASDERGIDVVREKIKVFAKLAVGGLPPGFTCPPLKIIVLDEADCMTSDAQSALRRTMEQHSRVTRFCIMCNYVSRIIDPITSRCAKFRFSPLPATAMTSRLQHIAEQESVTFSDGALDALMLASAGDMRRAVSLMQNAASLIIGSTLRPYFRVQLLCRSPWLTRYSRFCLPLPSFPYVSSHPLTHHHLSTFRPACKELSTHI